MGGHDPSLSPLPLPPPSDVLAPQLSVGLDVSTTTGNFTTTALSARETPSDNPPRSGGTRGSQSTRKEHVVHRLTKHTDRREKKEIEEVLQDKLWIEEAKYTREAQLSRPSTGSSFHRQTLLKNINTAINSNINQTPTSAFAEACSLEHLGLKLEVKRPAADYLLVEKRKHRPPHPTSPKPVRVSQHLKRYARSATKARQHREELGPLMQVSEVSDESYFKHLASKKEHEQLKIDAEARSLNPLLAPEVLDALFKEFSSFCERIKQRAREAGHDEDAAAVDTEETKKVLLDRFLTHHLSLAENTYEEDQAEEQEGHPEKRAYSTPKPSSRPRTAPLGKTQRTPHPVLMHSKDKSQHLAELLNRQQNYDNSCRTKLIEAHGKLSSLQSAKDPAPEDQAQIEALESEIKKLNQEKETIMSQPSKRDPAESPRVRCARVVDEVNKAAREAFYKLMEQHTIDHFTTLQRQQARHQGSARLLFNRSSSSMRKKIIEMRNKRLVGEGSAHSACLLFMPPPSEVRALS